jgi:hypothetical protein
VEPVNGVRRHNGHEVKQKEFRMALTSDIVFVSMSMAQKTTEDNRSKDLS